MNYRLSGAGAFAALVIASARADYAASVVQYIPGVGYATDFDTGLGYTIATAALGEPSRVTPGSFGGPVDPFDPPFTRDQLVSIGTGGSLTVQFASPIGHDSSHPYGLDFTIFGDTGFSIVNGNFSGGGVTDGSLFNNKNASTVVSVSSDGVHFYKLNPAVAPALGAYFPTDGAGSFDLPLNPSLQPGDFAGLDLQGIQLKYGGSAGGASYNLNWAIDNTGKPVSLSSIDFIRVDVLSSHVEIDGFSTVASVPEPGTIALGAAALAALAVGCRLRRSR
jgi:hypothetical protein